MAQAPAPHRAITSAMGTAEPSCSQATSAEALAATLKGREDQVIGVASRIIDARQ